MVEYRDDDEDDDITTTATTTTDIIVMIPHMNTVYQRIRWVSFHLTLLTHEQSVTFRASCKGFCDVQSTSAWFVVAQ